MGVALKSKKKKRESEREKNHTFNITRRQRTPKLQTALICLTVHLIGDEDGKMSTRSKKWMHMNEESCK